MVGRVLQSHSPPYWAFAYIFKGNCRNNMQMCVFFCYKIYLLVVTIDSQAFYYRVVKTFVRTDPMGTFMKLHLISGAVLIYTLLALAAICLAELGSAPQNVAF